VLIKRIDQQVIAVAWMIAAILSLNNFSLYTLGYEHGLYRSLFYLPLVLGTLWFALKGAIIISISTVLLYLPCGIQGWDGFSMDDFCLIGEVMVYFFITFVLGLQVQRAEKERHALVEAERLSAIGRTVVEVAHDMRAPLVAIGGFTAQVSKDLGDRHPKNREKLDLVVKETARLENMVRDMLDFGKTIDLHLARASLNDLVNETLAIVQGVAEMKGVELQVELASHMPRIFLDSNRLKQVILNLVTNAVQASSRGDHVKVSTHVTDGWNITLKVKDTGYGIKEKDREKVFLPFYSTKRDGTGLGLPIVKKIVEAHDGDLRFYPNKERGVTFCVQLPIASAKASETLT